jgi:hypothetical protein
MKVKTNVKAAGPITINILGITQNNTATVTQSNTITINVDGVTSQL